jgi:hypothetical protein
MRSGASHRRCDPAGRIVDAIRRDPIADGHVGTPNKELTDLAAWNVPDLIIHETNLRARRDPGDRPRL